MRKSTILSPKSKVLLGLFLIVFAVKVNAQAPTVSYSGPYTFTLGSGIPTLTPTTTGSPTPNGQTSTLAGSGSAGYANGTGTAASFNNPGGVIADAAGNIYLADAGNAVIRKITPAGIVTTLAGNPGVVGSANGTGTAATFNAPMGLGIDAAGNIYVADRFNYLIRKITPAGVVSTLAGNGTRGFADGAAASAEFYEPMDVKVDAAGNVFVADYGNYIIRKITPAGVVSTVAGQVRVYGHADGQGTAATFNQPVGIAFDPITGNLVVSDQGNSEIRVITPGGLVSTLAGNITPGFANGTGSAASFNVPRQVAVDASGNIYVADYNNNRIRRVTPAGVVTTLAGNGTAGGFDGPGSSAELNTPFGACLDAAGNLYVVDYTNPVIRKVATTPFTLNQGLPPGLSFNTTTGAISGSTMALSSSTTYTATAYNASGTGTGTVNLTVTTAPKSPTQTQNYIMTQTPRISGIVNDSTMSANNTNNASVQVALQYVDGLGRPIQTVQAGASPLGYDIIAPQAYDAYGREVTKYLPYVPQSGTAGSFLPNAVSADQGTFYTTPPSNSGVTAITDPYAQTSLESSPLNRPTEQGAPGVPWQLTGVSGGGHAVKMVYTLNNSTSLASDSVNGRQAAMYYTTINSSTYNQTLVANGYYPANALTVTISKDENWVSGRAGTVEEYKDIDGQVVLKRVYNYTGGAVQVLSTYYVYDDLGHLAFVLPPLSGADGAGAISTTTLNNLCYQYRYDERGRPIAKKIPGKWWEYVVYNTMDQPVATQDSLQRAANNWIITKYDAMGRPVMTGIWNNGGTGGTAITRASLQTILTGITTNLYEAPLNSGNGYTDVAWPTINVTATLTLDYYDTYANIPGLSATPYYLPAGISNLTRGLATVKKTAVLNTLTDQLWDVLYYDDLGRTTKTYAEHYLGGTANTNNYDLNTVTYNFTNAPTTTTRQHFNTGSTTTALVTVANTYLYDQAGRKLKTWEQITNGSSAPTARTLISKIDYNEIGQVLNKHLHSTDSLNFMQNIVYTYNERGWLLSSSAPLFAMTLYYNTSTNKAYNGNIMYQYWGTPGNLTTFYSYTYDRLNRMLVGQNSNGCSEKDITYDQMGNLTFLNRYQNSTGIDGLTYNYTSGGNPTNQLQSVVDGTSSNVGLPAGTTTYTYDANGNMLSGTNTVNTAQNKSFTYNLLNLPQVATVPLGTITYTYDAAGNKLRKVSTVLNNTTDYIGGIQYDGASTPSLSFIQTEEGKAVPNGANYDYTYYLGDNLGNTRVTFDTKTGVAVSQQTDDYYPFGMEILSNVTSPKNEYLYNKKEKQEELQEYDYGARFYDPVIVHWTTIDPLAENDRRWSPYVYGFDNAIRFEDPDGRWPDWSELWKSVKGLATAVLVTQTAGGRGLASATATALNTVSDYNTANNTTNPVRKAEAIKDFKTGLAVTAVNVATGVVLDKVVGSVTTGVAPKVEVPTVGDRAAEIHGAVPTATQNRTTIAVGQGTDANGNAVRVVGSSENSLRPAQKAMLGSNEVAASGPGHAETTVLNYAKTNGISISDIGASRPICQGCYLAIKNAGANPVTPVK